MNQHRPQKYFRPERSRSSNIGSLVNRLYQSSGPAGKLRGRAQDLVTTYLYHAREAAARNDRVTMEACLQYAEHYRRIMNRVMEGIGETRADQDFLPAEGSLRSSTFGG